MGLELVVVLALLAVAIGMFALGRPRTGVVAVLVIVALPLTGILSVQEALAGFADPNVVLVGAHFVVGAGVVGQHARGGTGALQLRRLREGGGAVHPRGARGERAARAGAAAVLSAGGDDTVWP